MFSNLFKREPELNSVYKYALFAAVMCLVITWTYFMKWWNTSIYLLLAVIFWLYMAVNIWANDVANNMGPAVWAKALTLGWAIIIAAIFEASWAIIAGWDVVDTIKKWIIDWSSITETKQFLAIMLATLLWASLWINIATVLKAPVSATHSIIGWLVWAWIIAQWLEIVTWSKIGAIAASWVISPLMWWIIAVLILISIRHTILKQDERDEAAKRWVPFYVWLMAWVFWTYLLLKWLKNLLKDYNLEDLITTEIAIFLWYVLWTIVYIVVALHLRKEKSFFKNSKKSINKLFNLPLVFAVALLSFAHWANDVANAIWPIAAINDVIKAWGLSEIKSAIVAPWIMVLWATGLAMWLMTFGWRLIKTVWSWITKLNQTKAYAVALSAAITVIIASQMWLPVSSTHIALGWVFWVGLLKQHIKRIKWKDKEYIKLSMIKSIAAAWIITLPISGWLSAITYLAIMRF